MRNFFLIELWVELITTPWFIPSASPVMSRLTSSFTCKLIFVVITTLIIHHSFTPGWKPTFSTNPSHLNTSSTVDCLHDHGTGPDLPCFSGYFVVRFFSLIFIARQHTDARYLYSNSVRPSVCPSVCTWRSGIRWKRLNIWSEFFFTTW